MQPTDAKLLARTLDGLHQGDCLDWMAQREPNSIHAIVTDPPFALKEYEPEEVAKMRDGPSRGIWRLPPKVDGHQRSPLPRFTVLSGKETEALFAFFERWAKAAFRLLMPGGHMFIAATPVLSHFIFMPMLLAGFEKRGEIVRLVQTLRGGDRPKNAEKEFSGVTVIPRGAWEPWGLFRKPLDGRIQDTLRKYGTGGLRRESEARPFTDLIMSEPTKMPEKGISKHPSLKPQAFMRQVVRAALPLGTGTVLDPFMGGGSTIAAAIAVGYESIGIELDRQFYAEAQKAIPALAALNVVLPGAFADEPTFEDVMRRAAQDD